MITSFLILLPPSDTSGNPIEWSPTWNVSVGDTFHYLLTVEALYDYPSSLHYPVPFSEINGTHFIVEIISLPQLPELINASILIYELLKITKTEMRFSNGSMAPSDLTSLMNPAFSLCIIPTGVRAEIDAILPDIIELDEYYMGGGYFAKFDHDDFNLGWYDWMIDSGGGYGGNFTQTSGIPFAVYCYWNSLSDPTPGFYLRADLI